MYATHDLIIESACLWLEDVKSNLISTLTWLDRCNNLLLLLSMNLLTTYSPHLLVIKNVKQNQACTETDACMLAVTSFYIEGGILC